MQTKRAMRWSVAAIGTMLMLTSAVQADGSKLSWVESRLAWARAELVRTEAEIVKTKQEIADVTKTLQVLKEIYIKTQDPAVADRIEQLRAVLNDLQVSHAQLERRAQKLRDLIRYLENLQARG